ncbi:hypothetical protein BJY00DRAFT_289773 [Aspergillus carlsbadensis]|nr:hypothetical protein BJY00DRAFT_289773 [Aspergillus carlsbadensis]
MWREKSHWDLFHLCTPASSHTSLLSRAAQPNPRDAMGPFAPSPSFIRSLGAIRTASARVQ